MFIRLNQLKKKKRLQDMEKYRNYIQGPINKSGQNSTAYRSRTSEVRDLIFFLNESYMYEE